MLNRSIKTLAWLLPAIAAQLACSLTGAPAPTPTTAPADPTAAPTSEVPPTAEPTAAPTEAPAPTEPPAPTPTAAPVGPSCQVAYVRAGQLYCRLDGGGEVRVTAVDGGSLQAAAISSDGAWVAYIIGVPDGPGDLFAIRVADAAGGTLTPTALANATNLPGSQPGDIVSARTIAFVPGTQTLLFDTRYVPAGGIQGPGEYINNDLWRVNVDGSGLSQLAPNGTAGRYAISPTGGHVALSSGNTISVLDLAAGSIAAAIEFDPILTYSEYAYKPEAVWSADGSVFTVAVPSVDPMAADTHATLHRINTAGIEEPLGLIPGNFVFGGVIRVAPTGERVAYGYSDGTGAVSALTLQRLPSDPAPGGVTIPEITWLNWSPDGARLAVGHRNVVANAQIVEPDGSLRSLDLPVIDLVWRGSDVYYLVVNGDGSHEITVLRPTGVEVLATELGAALWAVR
ncbi:MAG: hypothetical protein JNL73_09315 [Anaerolineales bacterium]|nr:hypothetical protein [Anaerolineales bacterium]